MLSLFNISNPFSRFMSRFFLFGFLIFSIFFLFGTLSTPQALAQGTSGPITDSLQFLTQSSCLKIAGATYQNSACKVPTAYVLGISLTAAQCTAQQGVRQNVSGKTGCYVPAQKLTTVAAGDCSRVFGLSKGVPVSQDCYVPKGLFALNTVPEVTPSICRSASLMGVPKITGNNCYVFVGAAVLTLLSEANCARVLNSTYVPARNRCLSLTKGSPLPIPVPKIAAAACESFGGIPRTTEAAGCYIPASTPKLLLVSAGDCTSLLGLRSGTSCFISSSVLPPLVSPIAPSSCRGIGGTPQTSGNRCYIPSSVPKLLSLSSSQCSSLQGVYASQSCYISPTTPRLLSVSVSDCTSVEGVPDGDFCYVRENLPFASSVGESLCRSINAIPQIKGSGCFIPASTPRLYSVSADDCTSVEGVSLAAFCFVHSALTLVASVDSLQCRSVGAIPQIKGGGCYMPPDVLTISVSADDCTRVSGISSDTTCYVSAIPHLVPSVAETLCTSVQGIPQLEGGGCYMPLNIPRISISAGDCGPFPGVLSETTCYISPLTPFVKKVTTTLCTSVQGIPHVGGCYISPTVPTISVNSTEECDRFNGIASGATCYVSQLPPLVQSVAATLCTSVQGIPSTSGGCYMPSDVIQISLVTAEICSRAGGVSSGDVCYGVTPKALADATPVNPPAPAPASEAIFTLLGVSNDDPFCVSAGGVLVRPLPAIWACSFAPGTTPVFTIFDRVNPADCRNGGGAPARIRPSTAGEYEDRCYGVGQYAEVPGMARAACFAVGGFPAQDTVTGPVCFAPQQVTSLIGVSSSDCSRALGVLEANGRCTTPDLYISTGALGVSADACRDANGVPTLLGSCYLKGHVLAKLSQVTSLLGIDYCTFNNGLRHNDFCYVGGKSLLKFTGISQVGCLFRAGIPTSNSGCYLDIDKFSLAETSPFYGVFVREANELRKPYDEEARKIKYAGDTGNYTLGYAIEVLDEGVDVLERADAIIAWADQLLAAPVVATAPLVPLPQPSSPNLVNAVVNTVNSVINTVTGGSLSHVIELEGFDTTIQEGESVELAIEGTDFIFSLTFTGIQNGIPNIVYELTAPETPIVSGPIQRQVPQGAGTLIGDMRSFGGLSAAFDGIKVQNRATSSANFSSYRASVGKDWGVGATKKISKFAIYAPSDGKFGGGSNINTRRIRLQGSSDNFSSSVITLWDGWGSYTNTNGEVKVVDTGINTTTAYQYHRILFDENLSTYSVAELEFWETTQ